MNKSRYKQAWSDAATVLVYPRPNIWFWEHMSDNYNINIVHSESDAKTRNEIEGGAAGAGQGHTPPNIVQSRKYRSSLSSLSAANTVKLADTHAFMTQVWRMVER